MAATVTSPGTGITATPAANARQSHPRLIPVEHLRERVQPTGWSQSDTLFVLLMFAAVAICAIVPLALL